MEFVALSSFSRLFASTPSSQNRTSSVVLLVSGVPTLQGFEYSTFGLQIGSESHRPEPDRHSGSFATTHELPAGQAKPSHGSSHSHVLQPLWSVLKPVQIVERKNVSMTHAESHKLDLNVWKNHFDVSQQLTILTNCCANILITLAHAINRSRARSNKKILNIVTVDRLCCTNRLLDLVAILRIDAPAHETIVRALLRLELAVLCVALRHIATTLAISNRHDFNLKLRLMTER